MTLDPYRPIDWQAFVLIPTPRARRRAFAGRVFIICVLAAIGGGLWGVN
jgi:hypothetical protein